MEEGKIHLIREVIDKLQYFVKLYGIDSLFIVGGFCRSMYLDRIDEVNDIDVASAYTDQALQLGGIFASEVIGTLPTFYERTGTAAVEYVSDAGKIRLEFQGNSTNSYMYNQEVIDWMRRVRLEDVPLIHNLYGRDFTINALVYSLLKKELLDPTERAEEDIQEGKIVSLLPAKILVKNNPVCILRAIRFSLLYDFRIDGRLKDEMKKNKDLLTKTLSKARLMGEFVKILKVKNKNKLDMLKDFKLDNLLLYPGLSEYLNVEEA